MSEEDKNDVKLVHFTILGGSSEEIEQFATQLNKYKAKMPFKVEFLVTNERVELVSLKYLLKELYRLYKLTRGDKE